MTPGDPSGREGAQAVAGEDVLATVRRDYGDSGAEYRAVREGAGIAEREDLATIVVTGRDPVRMIQGLITNDLAAAPAGRAVYGAMLTPKGRMIAELRAFTVATDGATEVWMLVPKEAAGAAAEHLRRSVPPLYARWRDTSDEFAVLGCYGPAACGLLTEVLGSDLPELAEDAVADVEFAETVVRVIGTRYAGGETGFDLLVNREIAPRLREALLHACGGQARPVGFGALEMLRIETGIPRGGRELTEEIIPTEAFESTGLMERAISFKKGCYTGQEVIVRIAHRGHVNRHLRGLLLAPESARVPAGTRIVRGDTGKDVGWITSVATSPRAGGPIALAFVRREVEPGQEVRVETAHGPAARVVALPFASADARATQQEG